jgi:membrane protease YdiL (CAAX protease family)
VNDWHDLSLELWAWLALALLAGVPVAALWFGLPVAHRRLLPPPRRRDVPWELPEIYLALFVSIFYPEVFAILMQGGTGFTPRGLWGRALALPFTVGTILLALKVRSGARLYQVGLSSHRWRQDLTFGYLVWLVLTPVVLSIHVLALHFLGKGEHPFERLAQQGLSPVEWCLVVFLAVVQAPLTEELSFRGILQPWLGRHNWGSHLAFAVAAAICFPWSMLEGRWPATTDLYLLALAPILFVLAMLPGYLLLPGFVKLPRREVQALYATALLFAAFHAGVWPTPVPLFVLGLGLGWLAWRTRSLTGPFLVHALFNAVASAILLSSKG